MRLTHACVALSLVAAACGGDDAPATDAAVIDGPEADAPTDAGIDAPFVPPAMLSETGLYSDIAAGTLAPGVVEFAPRWQLWSDDAAKRRFIALPPGTTIDTADMDYWQFPVGTKLWKQFDRGGQAIETRLLQKVTAGATFDDWYAVSFQWDAAGTDAIAVPAGVIDDTGHNDIPSRSGCRQCHDSMRVKSVVIGFSALQLDVPPPSPGFMTLGRLVSENKLSAPPTNPVAGTYFPLPPGGAARDALGYLHANCGGCHNERSNVFETMPTTRMLLRQSVAGLAAGDWTQTAPYQTTVGKPSLLTPGATLVVVHDTAMSMLFTRLTSVAGNKMPPLGRELADPSGSSLVSAWIDSL